MSEGGLVERTERKLKVIASLYGFTDNLSFLKSQYKNAYYTNKTQSKKAVSSNTTKKSVNSNKLPEPGGLSGSVLSEKDKKSLKNLTVPTN